jgi:hypothetical protein
MTRRFETRSPASARPPASRRTLADAARVGSAGWLGCAVLLAGIACQGQPAPNVESEPGRPAAAGALAPSSARAPSVAPAPSVAASSVGRAPAEPSARVGLAKYEESNAGAAPNAAAAPSSGAAPSGAPPAGQQPIAADAPSKAGGHTVQGTAVTEEPFSIWLQAESPVAAGSPATVEAVLVAKPPYHCNAEYPHKFKLGAAPAGISYPEATVKGAKVTAERSVLAIPVQAQSPGKATVSGTLQFSVCNDERCLVEKRELALNLEVK